MLTEFLESPLIRATTAHLVDTTIHLPDGANAQHIVDNIPFTIPSNAGRDIHLIVGSNPKYLTRDIIITHPDRTKTMIRVEDDPRWQKGLVTINQEDKDGTRQKHKGESSKGIGDRYTRQRDGLVVRILYK